MEEVARILEVLEQQCADYQAMYRINLEQRASIEREDLQALEESLNQAHRLMIQIHLRQARLPALDPANPKITERCNALRRILLELQELQRSNQQAAQHLFEQTQNELRRLGRGQRASREYHHLRIPGARLFDGTR
jgi:hypothetical protein